MMSESVTVTVQNGQDPARPGAANKNLNFTLNTPYFRSIPGLIKIAQLVSFAASRSSYSATRLISRSLSTLSLIPPPSHTHTLSRALSPTRSWVFHKTRPGTVLLQTSHLLDKCSLDPWINFILTSAVSYSDPLTPLPSVFI
jgi:hypothetical protein